ncbi:sigma-70 family RNA polymerase sigma factor [Carboxylicivirga sp. M1479]|uniref:sigma-70 family RNA polymerase sigma factor n=1 Tax=Carboxylicivirga sp. M1479 TaxID=2594476 RepID=UPI001178CAB8|nr:sigma-70 family RNA polymerase sigma factor [Carboxylicivirga sp. M1479]TRX66144.1 sigma-70 family RNA polymerase sigma factor [Carboxylicivirga sp. M1479]
MKHYLNPNKWVDSYADYLYRYALSRVNSDELAEDLVQETFLSGIKGSSNFQGNSNERTWLTAILKRKIIDYYRKKSSVKEFSLDQTDERFGKQGMMNDHWLDNKAPKDWQLNAQDQIENDEFKAILQACIRHLPEKWASCFILRVMDEMKGEEVCKELNITSSNMWVMLHRARLQLRDCVEKSWFK